MTTNTKIKSFVQGTVWVSALIILFIGFANIYYGFTRNDFWQGQTGVWQVLAVSFLTQTLDRKSS